MEKRKNIIIMHSCTYITNTIYSLFNFTISNTVSILSCTLKVHYTLRTDTVPIPSHPILSFQLFRLLVNGWNDA